MDFDELRLITLVRPLWLEFPGHPPSTNSIWRNNGRGRVYKAKAASSWDNVAIVLTRRAASDLWGFYDLSALKGYPLKLELFVERPTWRGKAKAMRHKYVRPDLSNFCKSAEDAITSALDLDDSAVIEFIAKKIEGPSERTLARLTFLQHI